MAKRKEELSVVISAQDAFSKVLKAAASAAAAVGLYKFMKMSIDAAIEQEDAEIKLAQALGKTSHALLEQASALQRTTKYADEQIITAQAMLAMFVKDEEQLKRLTRATLDFAAAKQMDLSQAAQVVAKSVGSSTNALTRYGIAIEGAAGSTQRIDSAVQGLAKTFGGQAEAQAKGFSGRMVIMKNQFGEFLEEIGNVIKNSPAIVRAIDLMAKAFGNMAQWIKNNRQWLIDLTNTIIVHVIRAMRDFVEGIRAVHVGWLFLRAGANYAIAWIYEKLLELTIFMKDTVLKPFDLLAQKLVDLGWIKVNPFETIIKGLGDLSIQHYKTISGIMDEVKAVNAQYTELSDKLERAAVSVEALKGKQLNVAETVGNAAKTIVETLNYTALSFEELFNKIINMSEKATSVTVANEQIMARAAQMRGNIQNGAYKAMENAMLRFIELHKFSVAEFAKAIMQTVKIELVGLAARAAVWALFEVGMGLASAAMGNAASAALHFAAAGQFALIGGAALVAAAAVNAVTGPGAEQPKQGETPSNPTYVSGTTEPSSKTESSTVITNVDVHVYNPLSNQNWDEIIELDVAPAVARARDRGVDI